MQTIAISKEKSFAIALHVNVVNQFPLLLYFV